PPEIVDVGGEVNDAIMAHTWHHVEPHWRITQKQATDLQHRNQNSEDGTTGTHKATEDGTTAPPRGTTWHSRDTTWHQVAPPGATERAKEQKKPGSEVHPTRASR
ncbi:hypothetical protein ACFV0W_31930, partial [Streptomyces anulatus]